MALAFAAIQACQTLQVPGPIQAIFRIEVLKPPDDLLDLRGSSHLPVLTQRKILIAQVASVRQRMVCAMDFKNASKTESDLLV